uniref:MFS transporter n=1 Tax=Botryobacter ruber TaxID=2171629 RepID=UPI000E0B1368
MSSSTAPKAPLIRPGILWPFILITSLFFLWGLANNMTDTLLAAFKRIMSMSDFQTSWIQIAFYGSYFCLALPAAIIIKKYTYKTGVLLGLGLFILGSLLFYPASLTMAYGHFLAALFILAGGLSILETAANPYIVAMGPDASGTRRLNLAQSFNPIGSITGVLLSKLFILSHLNQSSAEERAAMDDAQLAAIQS